MNTETTEEKGEESEAPGIQTLLRELNENENLSAGKFLRFNLGENSDELTVYNPSPITIDGNIYLLARVEKKKSEKGSKVVLFSEDDEGEWSPVEGWPEIKNSQDPFYCGVIDGFHVFGCVNTFDVPGSENQGYRTIFYKFRESFLELVDRTGETFPPFAEGPNSMKGVRLVQKANGKIGVFTRPQGDFGGRGSVGYFEIDSLKELGAALAVHQENKNPDLLIKNLFLERFGGENEWGGINEVRIRLDGKMNVLAHISDFGTDGKKNYYPIVFVFDPDNMSISGLKMVAIAEQFPKMKAKLPQLGSVIYSGGLVPLENGLFRLFVGVGDVEAGYIDIEDPFEAED